MEKHNGRFSLYGNEITRRQSKQIERWQRMFKRKYNYDPNETYALGQRPHPQLSEIFGAQEIVRVDIQGDGASQSRRTLASSSQADVAPLNLDDSLIISTIRMGFGHYRIAMAGASCARAMGFTPYWHDLLAIPGITTDVINYCNAWYSRFSRQSQHSSWFNKHVWEPVTTGESSVPGINAFLNAWVVAWPWRFVKTNIKDYMMSELFQSMYRAFPQHTPVLTAHMWNCMGAIAGGMDNVVDMVFDNWPMAFQLTEGAKHGIQTPSGYYGFRTMRGFDDKNRVLKPVPSDAVYYVGHHVDHELVENIEVDCDARMQRMRSGEPRRFLLTMGGAGAQRELFKAIIDHCIPKIKSQEMTLLVNLGDHADNWEWLQREMRDDLSLINGHFDWSDTKAYTESIRDDSATGLHVFLFDNTAHAVYATNHLMRVSDVLITKPSELAFYPIPKIFNERVGGHEMWGAVRGAEVGDSTCETRTIPETLQAIDLLSDEEDLLMMYCDNIVKNKQIGIYDGGYRSVELATGRRFERR